MNANSNSASSSSSIESSSSSNSYSIADEFERDPLPNNQQHQEEKEEPFLSQSQTNKQMRLKCANQNDFLFIGLTQYGVHTTATTNSNKATCEINQNDCLVTVDYLSNECNGLNTCDIQLDAQFLHTCKNHSDYLSVAYECVPGAKRVDICSNQETFLVDPSNGDGALASRFGSFYLSSPNYPNEYGNGLNNCTCTLDYVNIENQASHDDDDDEQEEIKNENQINLVLKVSFFYFLFCFLQKICIRLFLKK